MLINISIILGSIISLFAVYKIFRLIFSEISTDQNSGKKQEEGLIETLRSTVRANDLTAAVYDETNSIESMDLADGDDLHLLSSFQVREENNSIIRRADKHMSERSDPELFDDLHPLSSFTVEDPPAKIIIPRKKGISTFHFPKRDIIQL